MADIDLTQKLEIVDGLEKAHDLSGVSFAIRDGARILTEEAVDYVIEAIQTGVEILEKKDYVIVSDPASPA